MLKLGKVIKEKSFTVTDLSSFDITRMGWSRKPRRVEFSINPSPIGTGGFREAFTATSRQEGFDASTWVVKKYLPKVLEDIELINQTPKHHTKKVVQLRLRARNFALQLHQKVCKRNAEEVHGEVLS